MINYSIDTNIRQPILFIFAAASVVIIYFINSHLPSNLHAPSAMGLFGLMSWTFNKHLWKIPFINKFLRVPDLNGIWKGSLKREDICTGESEENIPIKFTITQSWTRISIALINDIKDSRSGSTTSFSLSVALEIQNDGLVIIRDIFQYENARGMSELNYSIDDKGIPIIKGRYISTALRKGYIDVEKEQ